MMADIFSNFDPMWFNICYKNTILMILMPLIMMSTLWNNQNKTAMMMSLMMSYIYYQLKTTKLTLMKMSSLTITTLFIFIIYMNITGMLPYQFSITSHIIFTMSLGLPLWMMLIISSIFKSTSKTLSHLLPDGAPIWLNPFLVLIESISIIVRPLTLSFRLAANMTAGHVVLCLISSFSVSISMTMFNMVTLMTMMYILFELMICLIQAYIFCLLISLYSNDHT